jgi:hypothetical protein
MSAPNRDDENFDDSLRYAPRWARRSPPVAPQLSSFASPPTAPSRPAMTDFDAYEPSPGKPEVTITDTPPMAPGIGGPNIDLPPPRLRSFEGDVAVKELRRRLALEPELIPEPPRSLQRELALPWVGRFLFILIMAAVVTFCATLLMLPREPRPQASVVANDVASAPEDAVHAAGMAEPTRLIVANQRAFANEPLPLGVSLNDAIGGETVTLVGLATGTRLSAGTPLGLTGWQMSARDLGKVYAHAPKDFIGVMDTAIDLRSARDRLVDSQVVRLEWVQKKEARLAPGAGASKLPPVVRTLDSEEIAMLLKRGEEFLKTGDVAAARLFLRRAASAGSAQAALALGVTFEPAFLAEQGVLGFAPDPAQARGWYKKAAEMGSHEAAQRLEQLANRGR